MLKERNFNIGNFIRLTSAGLEVADYVDVRDQLIQRYREVYGSDIDLSTASADGVFVNDLALIINNILQVMRSLYGNLDVDTASGTYLDALCRLSNVRRQEATRSTASIVITNIDTIQHTFDDGGDVGPAQNRLTCVDKSGNEWVSDASITLDAGESGELKVTCTERGIIDAPVGWIDRTLVMMNCTIDQPYECIRGTNIESDVELKRRRAQSSGADGVAVLESLVGALLETTGITDVKITNNNTADVQTAQDGTSIAAHDIYVVLRKQQNLTISDTTIGDLIHGKLTPGIRTTESGCVSANGVHKRYEYLPQMLGVTISSFNQYVYWKEAVPINPTITIKLTALTYFTTAEFETIAQTVYDYANNIKIGDPIELDRIFIEVLDADPEFRGQKTYSIKSSDVSVTSTDNPDTYYNYTRYSFTGSNGSYTLTIS